jgi:glycosyltransferase involved in cell wall biosynthesis
MNKLPRPASISLATPTGAAGMPVYPPSSNVWPWWPRRKPVRSLPAGTVIPPRALLIWRERPDLRAAFDLTRVGGREHLVWWYLRHGFAEFGLHLKAEDGGLLALNEPVPGLPVHDALPITWLMRGLADQAGIDGAALRTSAGQRRLLAWYFTRGLTRGNLTDFLSVEQARTLLADDPQQPGAALISRLVWDADPALADRFGDAEEPAFAAYLREQGARIWPILRHELIGLAPPASRQPASDKPFGVNLFGHARGRSGISEDLRMAALVLEEAAIPFIVRDVPTGLPEEEALPGTVGDGLPYTINLFAMAPPTTLAAITALGGADAIGDYCNIGFWPWELPELPAIWRHAYDQVDEVWASSRFTHAAFCRSSPVPVRHVPFAVTAEESAGHGRGHFGLPAGVFLFGFAFDGLSGFARKAPLGAIRAFRQAFAADDRSVGLVIKGLRVTDDPAWQQVLEAIGEDPRIHLVTRSLERRSLLDLWRALDCFVSLHRSEGFGRNIAECMLLGRPVLATAHSGNMDFTQADTAALVPCTLRPVEAGEYPFGTGQMWAEPDIVAAAALMQRMVRDADWRDGIAAAGRAAVMDQHLPAALTRPWREALTAALSSRHCPR